MNSPKRKAYFLLLIEAGVVGIVNWSMEPQMTAGGRKRRGVSDNGRPGLPIPRQAFGTANRIRTHRFGSSHALTQPLLKNQLIISRRVEVSNPASQLVALGIVKTSRSLIFWLGGCLDKS